MSAAPDAPLARSTALNFAGLVVPTLVQLVTVPLYISIGSASTGTA